MSRADYPPPHAQVGSWPSEAEDRIRRADQQWKMADAEMRDVTIKSLHMVEVLRQELSYTQERVMKLENDLSSMKAALQRGESRLVDAVEQLNRSVREVLACQEKK